jgi:hypothetical protein
MLRMAASANSVYSLLACAISILAEAAVKRLINKSILAIGPAVATMMALSCAAPVSASAECYVEAPLRPVYRSYIRRDVVEPGVYEVGRQPSLYGWTMMRTPDGYVPRRILLRPYKNVTHFQRPYIAFSRERLRIQPEGSRLVRVGPRTGC